MEQQENQGTKFQASMNYWVQAGQVAQKARADASSINETLGVGMAEDDPLNIHYPVTSGEPANQRDADPGNDITPEEEAILADGALGGLYDSDQNSTIDYCTEEEIISSDYPQRKTVEDKYEDSIVNTPEHAPLRSIPYQREPLTKAEVWGGKGAQFVVALADPCTCTRAIISRLREAFGLTYHEETQALYIDLDAITISDTLWQALIPGDNRLSNQYTKKLVEDKTGHPIDAISVGTASSGSSCGIQTESTLSPEIMEPVAANTAPALTPIKIPSAGAISKTVKPVLQTFKSPPKVPKSLDQVKKVGLIAPGDLQDYLSANPDLESFGLAIPMKTGSKIGYIPANLALHVIKVKRDLVASSVLAALLGTQDLSKRNYLKLIFDLDSAYWTGDLTNMIQVALGKVDKILAMS